MATVPTTDELLQAAKQEETKLSTEVDVFLQSLMQENSVAKIDAAQKKLSDATAAAISGAFNPNIQLSNLQQNQPQVAQQVLDKFPGAGPNIPRQTIEQATGGQFQGVGEQVISQALQILQEAGPQLFAGDAPTSIQNAIIPVSPQLLNAELNRVAAAEEGKAERTFEREQTATREVIRRGERREDIGLAASLDKRNRAQDRVDKLTEQLRVATEKSDKIKLDAELLAAENLREDVQRGTLTAAQEATLAGQEAGRDAAALSRDEVRDIQQGHLDLARINTKEKLGAAFEEALRPTDLNDELLPPAVNQALSLINSLEALGMPASQVKNLKLQLEAVIGDKGEIIRDKAGNLAFKAAGAETTTTDQTDGPPGEDTQKLSDELETIIQPPPDTQPKDRSKRSLRLLRETVKFPATSGRIVIEEGARALGAAIGATGRTIVEVDKRLKEKRDAKIVALIKDFKAAIGL